MFTGIITDLGRVRRIVSRADRRFEIACGFDAQALALGASVACNGCCLTVTERGPDWFAVDVSGETLSRTTLGSWREGTSVNLERSLRLGDELGGHLVSGHVDGVATILSVAPDGGSKRFVVEAPSDLARFIAEKGSVALDGTSLTVNGVEGRAFTVNIIPHTQAVTSWGALAAGDAVNIEIDMLARYVARLQEYSPS